MIYALTVSQLCIPVSLYTLTSLKLSTHRRNYISKVHFKFQKFFNLLVLKILCLHRRFVNSNIGLSIFKKSYFILSLEKYQVTIFREFTDVYIEARE